MVNDSKILLSQHCKRVIAKPPPAKAIRRFSAKKLLYDSV